MTVAVLAGVAMLAGILLAAMRTRRARNRAYLSPDGYQEVCVTINGKYRPNTLEVRQGIPVRIRFLRQENNPCSERVVFSAFGIDRRLPAFRETLLEFVPSAAGTFLFTCQLGMYRGKLVVTPQRAKRGPTKSRSRGKADEG